MARFRIFTHFNGEAVSLRLDGTATVLQRYECEKKNHDHDSYIPVVDSIKSNPSSFKKLRIPFLQDFFAFRKLSFKNFELSPRHEKSILSSVLVRVREAVSEA